MYVKTAPFVADFANGLTHEQAALAAATQSPAVFGALNQPSGLPAWKSIHSWCVLGTIDKIIPPAAQLFIASGCTHTSPASGLDISPWCQNLAWSPTSSKQRLSPCASPGRWVWHLTMLRAQPVDISSVR